MTHFSFRAKALVGAAFAVVSAASFAQPPTAPAVVAVGPQYGTSHVYVAPADTERFTSAFIATFGGHASAAMNADVTPTPSSTISQLVQTPVGTVSVFGFTTPMPAPFGQERNGYLVTDMDAAVRAAQAAGASVTVAPFPDPIGRDAVIQWPGGVNMQLYWHTKTPDYPALTTVPENRVYVPADRAADFVHDYLAFSHGKVDSDDAKAPGVEIGRPDVTYRRIRLSSAFGRITVLVTDGHLPFPYGHETTGYEVTNLSETLVKATEAGATVLVPAYQSAGRTAAMVSFPGGYIAEIHAIGSGH